MTDEHIISQLRSTIAGTFEVHQLVAKFTLVRSVSDTYQTVVIEIYDAGESVPNRYHCTAWAENDPDNIVTGNPEATIEDTIRYVHWRDLDKSLPS